MKPLNKYVVIQREDSKVGGIIISEGQKNAGKVIAVCKDSIVKVGDKVAFAKATTFEDYILAKEEDLMAIV